MRRPPALDALREVTHGVHVALEQTLIIARPEASADDYRRWAAAMWGWLSTFEATLWSASWPDAVDAAARDGKRAWLAADLRALGVEVATLPLMPTPPALDSLTQRFGVAYVLEGSTLGGQVLHRQLSPKIAPAEGRHLIGYGAVTGERWQQFSAALGDALISQAQINEASAAARATFTGLHRWLAERLAR